MIIQNIKVFFYLLKRISFNDILLLIGVYIRKLSEITLYLFKEKKD